MRGSKTILIVIAFVVVNALGLSFTLVNKGSYENSLYYRFTRQRFAWIVGDLQPKHAIEAGWARMTATLTAAATVPNVTSGPDSVQTRALVLDNGTTRAAMITVDLPMMPPAVAQALEKRLPKLGFAWKNVYLGATGSQSALGGWAKDYMGQRVYGDYNEQRVNQLTEAVVNAVLLAQKNRSTAQLGYFDVDQNGQALLSTTGNRPESEPLHLLLLRKPTGESALVYAGTVPSVSGPEKTRSVDRHDFCRQLMDRIEQQTHYFTLPMAGSVQDPNHSNRAGNENPNVLATRIAALLARQPLRTDSTLIAQTAPLIQNDPQIRISQNWRLKPWLAKALYGDYPADLKALRIGKTVFVGCPGGLSAELTRELLALPVADQRHLVITSYNGGNLGQLIPDSYYYAENSPYALGQFNRFGPFTAEFLRDMTQSLVSSLK